MSADNGYLLRKNKDGKYVLQMYIASDEAPPAIDDPRAEIFDDVEAAVLRYGQIEANEGMEIEYGLSVQILEPTLK